MCMNELIDSIQPVEMPDEPVTYSWFTQVWEKRCPFVVIGSKISNYVINAKNTKTKGLILITQVLKSSSLSEKA